MAKRKQPPKLPKLVLTALVVLAAIVGYLGQTDTTNKVTQAPATQNQAVGSSAVSSSYSRQQASSRSASRTSAVAANQENSDQQNLQDLTYGQQQIIAINDNRPTFSKADLSLAKGSWQHFSDLDHLNRAGPADAMLGKDLMPTEKRERLYVDPTGYHNKKVKMGDHQGWLYNRCHLIGFQLTGQNNNLKNLVTGTRSLNDPAMTYYENQIAQYIKSTNHHVRYQVRPYFKDNELVARGIQMQGASVEDDRIDFNIYIFNVQTGYQINYADGTSQVA